MSLAHDVGLAVNFSVPSFDGRGLGGILQTQADAIPGDTAVVFDGKVFTYADLYSRARKFAAELLACGVTRGDRVGVLFPNNPDYVAAFFAVLGIGAVVVPINALLKSEEVAHIIADSQAKALIVFERGWQAVVQPILSDLNCLESVFIVSPSQESGRVRSGTVTITTLCSEKLTEQGRKHSDSLWTSNTALEDLAVLVYTSGTTGKPKGAMLSHSNLFSTIDMSHKLIEIEKNDRFLVVLPLCHIYGLVVVMLGVLSRGGTLVVMEKFDPALAVKLIEQEKITAIPAVPAMYQFMMMELEKTPRDLSSLRVCLSGAAPMALEQFERLSKFFPVHILEGYGLTETSSVVCINVSGKTKVGSVGLPAPGLEVIVVDQSGKRMPHSKEHVGEIVVKGPNVMQGYYGKPEATAECIQDGWFRTGDLGYRDEDGYIYIVGRSKELIIRGGQNIYPREVEDVIVRLPQVAEVAVIGVADQFMGERVKAVVVLRPGQELSEDDIKGFCAKHLADYKVPRLVEFIGALPRNSTGKVVKRLLQDCH